MNKNYINVTVANIMKAPSHMSELHTQALYGDEVRLLNERVGAWQKIEVVWDAYHGWVLVSQISNAQYSQLVHEVVCKDIELSDTSKISKLVSGTFIDYDLLPLALKVDKSNLLESSTLSFEGETLTSLSKIYINSPYMWGGNTTFGIDCSGLTQMIYRFYHYKLPHFASEQFGFGRMIDFVAEAKIGDLAFFINEQNEVNHVGMLLSTEEIIHASESNGKVAIDYFDQEGIVNKISGQRTHKLRAIKRLIS